MVINLKRVYYMKILSYVILAFCFLKFYFIDSFLEYTQGSTTFSVSNQEVVKLPIPEIIVCFNPLLKPSSIEQYGIRTLDSLTSHSFNLSNWSLLQKLALLDNEDFELSLSKNRSKVPFEALVISTIRHGLCHLITHNLEVPTKDGQAELALKFNKSLEEGDLPKEVKVWISPKGAWHGIIVDDWPYIDQVRFDIPVKESFDQIWTVKMSQTDLQYRNGVSNFTECIEEYINTEVNCPVKCFPLHFNFLASLPPCHYINESNCMFDALIKDRGGRYRCLKLKNNIQYKADFQFTYELEAKNETGIQLLMYFDRLTKNVQRERLVITTADFIGSAGGSLGLFLGFSCFTFLSGFLDRFLSCLVSKRI